MVQVIVRRLSIGREVRDRLQCGVENAVNPAAEQQRRRAQACWTLCRPRRCRPGRVRALAVLISASRCSTPPSICLALDQSRSWPARSNPSRPKRRAPPGVARSPTPRHWRRAVKLRADVRGPRAPTSRRRPFATRGTPQYRHCTAENGSQTLEHVKVIRHVHRAQVLRLELRDVDVVVANRGPGPAVRVERGGSTMRTPTATIWNAPQLLGIHVDQFSGADCVRTDTGSGARHGSVHR
jgi:hypothetical protein